MERDERNGWKESVKVEGKRRGMVLGWGRKGEGRIGRRRKGVGRLEGMRGMMRMDRIWRGRRGEGMDWDEGLWGI